MATITIGSFTFDAHGSAVGIVAYDWSDLVKSTKRGANRVVPQVAGRAVRGRVKDEVRAGLAVRVLGSSHADVDLRLDDLEAINLDTVQTLTLDFGTHSRSGDVIVEEIGPVTYLTPTVGSLVVDLTFPGGRLTVDV
jgi:hypothetical protein